ncbi:hypothetical protein FHW19_000580 [Ochrobactrum anthropi]|uniref:PP_RS20740 family protein n=1 Tax=Brucella anthropi TaxID=529 RepID=UPI0015F952E7|nr:hypothetical protein [Brucella anthropi]MBA8858908.1 hypothetical protein [Brucella anthropi]
MSDNHDDDDILDFALPPEPKPLAAPEPLSFAPWHRPRKQYVRVNQWLHHTKGIIEKIGAASFSDGQPLKYLTLPGPDLLDVRMIAEFCSSLSIRLSYTGFCYTNESEEKRLRRNINEFSLTHSQAIASSSTVVRARLEDVVIKNSDAQMALFRGGPFDIINIDACEPLANDNNQSGRLVDAIRSVTEFQLTKHRRPWLLLLTTPIQRDSISEASLKALHGQVCLNAQRDEEFAQKIAEKFEEGENIEAYLNKCCAKNGEELISVFSLGVAKWLIHLAEQAQFKVIKLKSYSYSMFKKEPFDPNMVSLCFLFQPQDIPIHDGSGLTANPPPVQAGQQPAVSTHIRALSRAYDIENLDALLDANKNIRDDMIAQTKELLQRVGYPVDDPEEGYDMWLAKEISVPPSNVKVA